VLIARTSTAIVWDVLDDMGVCGCVRVIGARGLNHPPLRITLGTPLLNDPRLHRVIVLIAGRYAASVRSIRSVPLPLS
jgi:hypothetical protein